MDTAAINDTNFPSRSLIGHNQESKRERFQRLAEQRLDRAINAVRLLENLLQNPYSYQYDYRDIENIVNRLSGAVGRLKFYWRS